MLPRCEGGVSLVLLEVFVVAVVVVNHVPHLILLLFQVALGQIRYNRALGVAVAKWAAHASPQQLVVFWIGLPVLLYNPRVPNCI